MGAGPLELLWPSAIRLRQCDVMEITLQTKHRNLVALYDEALA